MSMTFYPAEPDWSDHIWDEESGKWVKVEDPDWDKAMEEYIEWVKEHIYKKKKKRKRGNKNNED